MVSRGEPAPVQAGWRSRVSVGLLLCLFLCGTALQLRTGLADNGDFTRSIKFFSPGPVGIRPNFPVKGTALWYRRFYEHWLPLWTLQRQREKIVTSAVLLWLPGVLASGAAASKAVSLPWLSLVPRLLLSLELWVVLSWAARQRGQRWLVWTLGLPLVLIFTTTDNAAYLNSFYQEAGSQVFVLPVLFALVWLWEQPSWPRLAAVVFCVALLTTAKSSTIYWPIITLPFGWYAWTAHRPCDWRAPRIVMFVVGVLLAGLVACGARAVTEYREANVNPYHSLFYGTLMFSRQPQEQLQRLGLVDGVGCIGVSAYREPGKSYFEKHAPELGFEQPLLTIWREPAILYRLSYFGLSSMQDISLEYLGKYSESDTRHTSVPPWQESGNGSEERLWTPSSGAWLNLWSYLKFHAFPTGLPLAVTLAAFGGFSGWRLRDPGAGGALALAGLLATLATVADIGVALLGEGRHEIIKHLYLANLLFDLATVASVSGIFVWAGGYIERRRGFEPVQMTSANASLARINTV